MIAHRGRVSRLALAFLLATGSVTILAPSTAQAMPHVVVNHTGDASDNNPGDGFCDTGGPTVDVAAACTLRAAIQEANASPLIDEIHFDIPVSDLGHAVAPFHFLIEPDSGLPAVSTSMTIDGTTQPGYTGRPVIVINGGDADGADGLLVTSGFSVIRGLNIQEFDDEGIELIGNSNVVVGNWIGVTVTGTSANGNDDGVLVRGSHNRIGGPGAEGNLISGNADDGVSLDDASHTRVVGNIIGLNAAGTSAIPNQGDGVAVQFGGTNNRVGPRNVISGNGLAGVWVNTARDTIVEGSLIGLNRAGTTAVPNLWDGVEVGSSTNRLLVRNNVISGNGVHGVDLHFGAIDVDIEDNRIGTNTGGSGPVPNLGDGIRADSDGVDIIDNLISGNDGDGIRLERTNSVVRGNKIGTDLAGSSAIANGESGIDTGSGTGGSLIGGTSPGDANVIAFNTEDGVSFRTHGSVDAAVLGNSIFGNGHLGIDISPDGQNTNDPGDPDIGPNQRINHPVIISAETAGATAYIDFTLDVTSGWHRVEFFTNPNGVDPSGFGEGEVFVDATHVNHPGGGAAAYTYTASLTPGEVLTATVTRCANTSCTAFAHTSEFSAARTVVIGNHAPSIDPIGGPFTVDELSPMGFTATVTDPDAADTHVFGLVGEPAGATITPGGVFTWTPSEVQGPGVYTFDVTVTDNGTPAPLTDTQPITITVNEINTAPVMADPGSHNVDELTPISFTVTAVDVDQPANSLTFTLGGEPAGATITPGGVFSWTPTEDQGPGSYTFDITVTDNGTPALADTRQVTINVAEINTQPTINNPGDQTDPEATTIDLPTGATDPDIPTNTLTYTATGLPPGLNIDPNTGQITGTITYDASFTSPHNTTITVTDDGNPNLADTANFAWTTPNTNRPPNLNPIGNHTTNELDPFTLNTTANDPDTQDTLTYSLNGQPTGATIDPNTGQITWTPSEVQGPGVYTFDVTVTDNGTPAPLTDTQPITITVNEINTAPVMADPGSHNVDELTPISFTVTAVDVDQPANSLTFTLGGEPAGATITPGGVFSWTPTEDQGPGSYTFDITVTDNGTPALADTRQVTINVAEINTQPTINNPGDQTDPEATTIDLPTGATDPDIPTNTLTYTATGLPPGLNIDPNTGQITGTITYDASFTSPHNTTITVTDDGNPNLADTANFTWTTPNTNRPPNLNPIGNHTTNELDPFTLNTTANDPDTQDTLTYSLNGQPTGATIDPNTGQITWTPSEVQGPGVYTFDVTVTDNGTPAPLTDTQPITITVNEINTPPVAVDDFATMDEDGEVDHRRPTERLRCRLQQFDDRRGDATRQRTRGCLGRQSHLHPWRQLPRCR